MVDALRMHALHTLIKVAKLLRQMVQTCTNNIDLHKEYFDKEFKVFPEMKWNIKGNPRISENAKWIVLNLNVYIEMYSKWDKEG